MKQIAQFVREGAMAYLKQQYKIVIIVFAVLAVLFAVLAYFGVQNPWVPFAFLTGGLFSGLAGFIGMKTATYASARTANAARRSLNSGLKVAFRSGAVMGLTVVGLGLLDIALWWLILNAFVEDASVTHKMVVITTTMLTFGMGASTQALFARVGGGIYTKAADVGADLVGKVEAGIPEDDPRNPATIADNVGDNVGDVAGMGADLYVTIISCDQYRKYREVMPVYESDWLWTLTPWSCNAGNAYFVRYVSPTGEVNYYSAYNSIGVAPACKFSSKNLKLCRQAHLVEGE